MVNQPSPSPQEELTLRAHTDGAQDASNHGNPLGNRRKSATPALAQVENILDCFAIEIETLGLVGEQRAAKLLFLALTSRVFDRPISVVLKGPSSAGKSYVVKQTLRFSHQGRTTICRQ